jgi:hypothetical protein
MKAASSTRSASVGPVLVARSRLAPARRAIVSLARCRLLLAAGDADLEPPGGLGRRSVEDVSEKQHGALLRW